MAWWPTAPPPSMPRPAAVAHTPFGSNFIDFCPRSKQQSSWRFSNDPDKIDEDSSISRLGETCSAEQLLSGRSVSSAAFVVCSARTGSSLRVAARATNEVPSRTQMWTGQHLNTLATSVRSAEEMPVRAEAANLRCSSRRVKRTNTRRARLDSQRSWASSPKRLQWGLFSSSQEDFFVSGEVTSREEFEEWSAAAAAAAAEAGGVVRSSADFAGGPTTTVPIEQVDSGRTSPSGINWVPIVLTVLDQLIFLGFFTWLATPAIRAQVCSLFVMNVSGAALGALGAVPMFVYGLYLGTRHWTWFKTSGITSGPKERLKLFGRRRQVARVTAVSTALALLVGFCEECVYRGLIPLLLAAKTRFPLAAIVGISATFCGARHAGTLGSAFDAAVLGIYVHCLLLSTGNLLVPVVAHAVFDGILFVAEHIEDTRPVK